MQVDQTPPMAGFLLPHRVKQGGSGWKRLPKTFGIIGVDALILFLESDGKRQDFLRGKALKASHKPSIVISCRAVGNFLEADRSGRDSGPGSGFRLIIGDDWKL